MAFLLNKLLHSGFKYKSQWDEVIHKCWSFYLVYWLIELSWTIGFLPGKHLAYRGSFLTKPC